MKKLVDWLIKRRLKQLHIPIVMGSISPDEKYKRTLNTLRENKVMVKLERDGVYVRLAGDEKRGEAFSLEWGKVMSF